MNILIVTSCTNQKTVWSPLALTCEDFAKGGDHVRARERNLLGLLRPAQDMYDGQQHVRLIRGIKATREQFKVTLYIVSAGYGIVDGAYKLAPYECTFAKRSKQDLKAWATRLHIPSHFRAIMASSYDLGLILLGNDYLAACQIDGTLQLGGPTLVLCGYNASLQLPHIESLKPIILGHTEATRFSCGLIGLKGEVAARVLKRLAEKPSILDELTKPSVDVRDLID